MVGDVTAPVGAHEVGADRRRRHEHVGGIGRLAERVDVRVLEEEQVVVGGALEERPLELVGLPVRDPPEPADAQRAHASSASQSVPWIVSFMAWRNAAA